MFGILCSAYIEALFVCQGCVLAVLAKCSKPCQELVQVRGVGDGGIAHFSLYVGTACALVKFSSANVWYSL